MADQLTITGKFLGAGPIKQIGQNNRDVRSFYLDITDNIQYPNTPELQLWGDKVHLVDTIQKGQLIEVKFRLSGRKYVRRDTGKDAIMTNVEAWQINVIQLQSAAARPAAQPAPQQPRQTTPVAQPFQNTFDDESNDLPF